MRKNFRALTTSMGTIVLAASLATGAWGQAGVAGGAAAPVTGAGEVGRGGGELESLVAAKGKILCVDCTLEGVREAQPNVTDLYQLTRATPGEGHVVMEITGVSNKSWWETIVGLSHEFPVRAEEKVWHELTAEENRFKDIEILGILRRSRTLEISEVNIDDRKLSELETGR
ncbi:MAG: hypothetical protein AB7G75_13875 [Candidatus Binatia bacterium]